MTPPEEYFREISSIIKANGGLIISDEVQSGFGRTGDHWFGIEHWGIEPDIITCAKAMANGTPVGATVTTPEIAAAIKGPQNIINNSDRSSTLSLRLQYHLRVVYINQIIPRNYSYNY